MSTALEKVIRPFQQGDVFTARRAVPTPTVEPNKISDDVVLLEWSGKNDGQYVSDELRPETYFETGTTDMNEDKTKRVVKRERIENPDDSSQYIMVDRLESTTMKDPNTGQIYNLKFEPWDK